MESRQVTAFCPFRQVIKVNSFRVASSSYDVFTAISGFFGNRAEMPVSLVLHYLLCFACGAGNSCHTICQIVSLIK